jgi:hexosaminidase
LTEEKIAALLPWPKLVRFRVGRCTLGPDPRIVAAPGAEQAMAAVRRVLDAVPWPQAPSAQIRVGLDASLAAEGYRLVIGPESISITAADPAGAFYAAQTIRQLLPADAFRAAVPPGRPWTIPCAEIEDAPALAWRGAHLDVARHFFPKHTVLRFIDMLAAHKMNRLHLHLTDDQGWRIESRRYPALHEIGSRRPGTQIGKDRNSLDGKPHGGYYTLADLAEINAYAAARMITVVPEIEVPGHARAFLAALPELAASPGAREHTVATSWGIFEDIMSPLPATLQVLTELFGELLTAVPARYVHIGGDECVLTDWEDNPRIGEHRKALGLPSAEALHAYFLRQVADLLADRFGARAIVWDEGFTSTVSGTGLRNDTIVMAWHGMEVARQAAAAGYDVIAAPMMPAYFDYAQSADPAEPLAIGVTPVTVEDVAAFSPGQFAEDRARLLGAQFQLWTEYIPDPPALEYMAFPRACAFAEVAWTGRSAPWAAGDEPERPPLRDRLAVHLARLTAADIAFRPLTGPGGQ